MNNNSGSHERLVYRVSRAAELLDVSRSQVYNLIERGQLDSVRVGNSIRIPAEAVRRIAAGENQENR